MAIIDEKRDAFGNIAACRSINEGFPELQLTDSFPNLDNAKDSIGFLSSMLKSLIGFEKLRDTLVDTLSSQVENIEEDIKKALKLELKSFVNCGVNPSIPDFLKDTGSGVVIEVDNIDLTGILKTDPTSDAGELLYTDASSGLNSSDLNTFIFNVIQNDGNKYFWQDQSGNNLLSFEFNSTLAGQPNNTLTIKASPYYSNNKTLTDLNNAFVDSINLFNSEKLLTNILDKVFGVISININKSEKQLEREEKVKDIVDRISSSDEDDVVDDNYFEFDTPELSDQQRRAKNRKNGIQELVNCDNVESSINFDSVKDANDRIKNASNLVEKKTEIQNSINNLSNESAENVSEKDKYTVELNFIDDIIQNLNTEIVNVFLSPKVVSILAINYKVIVGIASSYDGPIDFIKQNKQLIKELILSARDKIVEILLSEALKAISSLVSQKVSKIQTEVLNNQKSQLLSLVGVPQSIIRTINDLS